MNLNAIRNSFFLTLMLVLLIIAFTTNDPIYRDLCACIVIITGALISKSLANNNANN